MAGRWRAGRAAGLCSHPDCAAAWLTPVPRHQRASPARRSSLGRRSRPGPYQAECPRSGRACSSWRATGRPAALAAGAPAAWRGNQRRRTDAAGDDLDRAVPRLAAGDGGRAGCGGETPVGSPMSLPGCRNVPAGRLCAVPAWHAAALIAMTSPTGADRQLRLHVAAGPSCRCLAGTEHRTAPAARADRLNGALAQLPDRGGVRHGHRCLTGVRPGGGRRSASRRRRPWRGTPPA